jgi:hypothetical protein
MVKRYIEKRKVEHTAVAIAADIARYTQARQHLGAAVVLCDDPAQWATLVRRQWLKLARELQRRRSLATDAVEIMKYTYTITQMQHMRFVNAQLPESSSEAVIVFSQTADTAAIDGGGLTLYVLEGIPAQEAHMAITNLTNGALITDYSGNLEEAENFLVPRAALEALVQERWRDILTYLTRHHIPMESLVPTIGRIEAMDDAIDALLNDCEEFLRLASTFARALELARPLEVTSPALRTRYELMMVLAHRVQCLSPSGFNTRFLQIYADDARFLHDVVVTVSPREQARQALTALWRAFEQPEVAAA